MFSSLGHSFLIHLQLVLVEAWPDIAEVMIEKNQLWALYALSSVCISYLSYVLLTILYTY